ncbi:MAG: hypothetical protein JWL84_6341 [Rhodospirillales bacterium]|nr:hypothetical protein [Rhodospirillales bacterium]
MPAVASYSTARRDVEPFCGETSSAGVNPDKLTAVNVAASAVFYLVMDPVEILPAAPRLNGSTAMRHLSLLLAASLVALAPGLMGCSSSDKAAPPTKATESEQQLLVDKARVAVTELRNDRVVGAQVNDMLRSARGVLIFPNLLRGGFIVGAAGGTGTLLARTATGWSDPAFYFTGEGSFGLQIGGEAGRVMFIIRNDGAFIKIVNGNVNLGADVSVAIGPVGAGAAGAATPNLRADLVAFSVQEGLFGGIAFHGGVVSPLVGWNEAYYGPGATPRAIVIENRFHNPGAQGLKNALALGR